MTSGLLDGLPEAPLDNAQEQVVVSEMRCELLSADKRAGLVTLLVLHSMREACHYATRCCRGGLPEREVYSLAYAALIRAAKAFQPDNIRFLAYAKPYIRGEICRVWKSRSLVKHVSKENMIHTGSHETVNTVDFDSPRHVGLQQEEREGLPKVKNQPGTRSDLGFQTADPDFDGIHAREVWETLRPMCETKLTPKERQVVYLHYQKGLTFGEIAVILRRSVRCCDRRGAQAIHVRAIRKLRAALARSKKIL